MEEAGGTMEEIIIQILRGNNIAENTAKINKSMEDVGKLLEILNVMTTSQTQEVRQFVAVSVRTYFNKGARPWIRIPETRRSFIKAGILQSLIDESVPLVKRAIASLVAVLARYDLSKNQWPELEGLITHLYDQDVPEKEFAFMILTTMAETSVHVFDGCLRRLLPILEDALNTHNEDPSNKMPYNAVMVLNSLWFPKVSNICLTDAVDKNFGTVLTIIKVAAITNEARCLEMMEFMESVICSRITSRYFEDIYSLLAVLGLDEDTAISVRVKAVYLLGVLAANNKRSVIRKRLLNPILSIMFEFMCAAPEDDDAEEYFVDFEEDMTLTSASSQMLNSMAMYLPSKQVLPTLLKEVDEAMKNNNEYRRKAAFLTIGILAEGCADNIKENLFDAFINYICEGMVEGAVVIKNAAYFALGQCSEFLQPEISQSQYSNILLPHVVRSLNEICDQLRVRREQTKSMERTFYAIEMYCRGLGDDNNTVNSGTLIQPYLLTLMEKIFEVLNQHNPIKTQICGLDVLGAVVGVAKNQFLPYMNEVVDLLRNYFTKHYNFDTSSLLTKALETLGELWAKISKEHMAPLLQDSMEVASEMLYRAGAGGPRAAAAAGVDEEDDDPELRGGVYSLVGSIAVSMGPELTPNMDDFLQCMITALSHKQGLEDDDDIRDDDDELSDEMVEGEDSPAVNYEVENSYRQEKEQALNTLKDLMENTGPFLMPYLAPIFTAVYKLMYRTDGTMREYCMDTMTALLIYRVKHVGFSDSDSVNGVRIGINTLSEMVRQELDLSICIKAVRCLKKLLVEVLPPYLPLCDPVAYAATHRAHFIAEYASPLGQLIILVLTKMVVSLESGEEEWIVDEGVGLDSQAEEELIQAGAGLLPVLGRVMPPRDFLALYNKCLPYLLKRNEEEPETKVHTVFNTGVLAKCVTPLSRCEEARNLMFGDMFHLFTSFDRKEKNKLLCNCLNGLGELFYRGTEQFQNTILNDLLLILCEMNDPYKFHPELMDNMAGAIARVIMARPDIIPHHLLVPALIQQLPLKKDFMGNLVVYRCLAALYQLGSPDLAPHMARLVTVTALMMYSNPKQDAETKQLMTQLMCQIRADFVQDFDRSVCSLPDMAKLALDNAIS